MTGGDLGFLSFVSRGPRCTRRCALNCTLSVIRTRRGRGTWVWVWIGKGMYKWPFGISRVLVKGFFSFQHVLSLMTSNGAVRFAHFQLPVYF